MLHFGIWFYKPRALRLRLKNGLPRLAGASLAMKKAIALPRQHCGGESTLCHADLQNVCNDDKTPLEVDSRGWDRLYFIQ